MKWTVRFTEPAIKDVLEEIRYHKEREPRRDRDFLVSLRIATKHMGTMLEP